MRVNWPIPAVRFHLALAFALMCSSFGVPAKAEIPSQPTPAVFDLDQGRELSVPIGGLWRFQVGDDVDGANRWASPSFDDSQWPLIRADRSWSEQGFDDLSGSAWYRAKLRIPAGTNH